MRNGILSMAAAATLVILSNQASAMELIGPVDGGQQDVVGNLVMSLAGNLLGGQRNVPSYGGRRYENRIGTVPDAIMAEYQRCRAQYAGGRYASCVSFVNAKITRKAVEQGRTFTCPTPDGGMIITQGYRAGCALNPVDGYNRY